MSKPNDIANAAVAAAIDRREKIIVDLMDRYFAGEPCDDLLADLIEATEKYYDAIEPWPLNIRPEGATMQ